MKSLIFWENLLVCVLDWSWITTLIYANVKVVSGINHLFQLLAGKQMRTFPKMANQTVIRCGKKKHSWWKMSDVFQIESTVHPINLIALVCGGKIILLFLFLSGCQKNGVVRELSRITMFLTTDYFPYLLPVTAIMRLTAIISHCQWTSCSNCQG